MKSITYLLLIGAVCVSCTNYHYGEKTATSKRVHRERIFYEAIPWKKRVQFYEYKGPDSLRIQAISCYDYRNSEAVVNVTEGGIGFNHVTLRLKSQRSYRLDYAIEIFS